MKTRFLRIFVCILFSAYLFTSSAVYAKSVDNETITSYLQSAGFSDIEISNMSSSEMLSLYNSKGYVQERTVVYGIYTDNYQIDYSLAEDGSIIMDEENQAEFTSFINNPTEIAKVLHDKNESVNISNTGINTPANSISLTADSTTSSNTTLNQMTSTEQQELKKAYLDMYSTEVGILQNSDFTAAVTAASNLTQSITITHKSYNTSTKYLTKSVSYVFDWEYSPFWTLTDQFAIAWSKEFNYPGAGEYNFTYKAYGAANPSGERAYYKVATYTADDVHYKTPGAGVGHKYDIKRSFFASYDYAVYRHYVSLSFDITRYWNGTQNEEANYVAKYYHKIIGIEGSITLSKTPGISISWASSYDELQNVGGKFSFAG